MNDHDTLQHLFENNRRWAAEQLERDPDFFNKLTGIQKPDYLWIGCSDSRVPANEITGLQPGEVFVHRNIANVVVHADLNCLSVLQFAVDQLQVPHVIVCGHYGCGGVRAALDDMRLGLADNWLRHVQDVREHHGSLLDVMSTPDLRADRLCELNVMEQVRNVCRTTIVGDAWTRGQKLAVHGWVYRLSDGRIRDLGVSARSPDESETKYYDAVKRLASARR
jgi:carbonic anhydrase